MAGKKKEFDKNGPFQTRFRDLFSKSNKTQDALAAALGVSRPTLVGWLDGKSLPDILALKKISKLFDVSADYLLGLSDTVSPDVSVRAAMAYTGLSEAAVEYLHIGLNDSVRGDANLPEKIKNENLRTASALIQSNAFANIIQAMNDVAKEAYMERIMSTLVERYFETAVPVVNSKFHYANDEEHNVVTTNLCHVLKMKGTRLDKKIMKKVPAMSDHEILIHVYGALSRVEQAHELHQFRATKAFTAFIDQVVKSSQQKADRRLEPK